MEEREGLAVGRGLHADEHAQEAVQGATIGDPDPEVLAGRDPDRLLEMVTKDEAKSYYVAFYQPHLWVN